VMAPLLDIQDLRVHYLTRRGVVRAVDGVSISLGRGEVLGLVGESGCGKSTLGLSVLRLVPPPGAIVGGSILFDGVDLTRLSDEEMRRIRGKRISMIFQDPMTSLNPVMRIKDHFVEMIRTHEPETSEEEAVDRAARLMARMGIEERRLWDYPHQLSGGMRQRVMIALALILGPDLVIADEPTTALDTLVQAQIIDLLKEVVEEYGVAMMLITHDLGVVAELADRIAIMYAGKIVEVADAESFFDEPLHPYSRGLLDSVLTIESEKGSIRYIPGSPPDLRNPPKGCRFHPRCPYATDRCRSEEPPRVEVDGRQVWCFRWV